MMNYAILLSGGVGIRMGAGLPKQYRKVNNKMLITYTLERLAEAGCIDGLVIVADEEWWDEIAAELENIKFLGFAKPGENRQLSIYSGLCFLKDKLDTMQAESIAGTDGAKNVCEDCNVLIQDAARPNTSEQLIRTLFDSLHSNLNSDTVGKELYDGAIPVLPMKDTVYISQNGTEISSLIDRATLFAGQAPEVFRLDKYLKANEALLPDKIKTINGSTEPAVLAGMKMKMIPGEEGNFKITTPADFERFEAICK